MKLDLNDLVPVAASLVLSGAPGKTFTLGKITLRTRAWLQKRFKPDELKTIFADNQIVEMSEIAYFILVEKDAFPTLEGFQDAIVTLPDMVALHTALLTTLGLSEPVIKKLSEQDSGNAQTPVIPTGDKSLT